MDRLIEFVQRMPTPVRWALWLPASLATFLVTNIGINLVGKFLVLMSRDGWGPNFFEYLVAPGFAGYLAITIPMTFVPARGRAAALVLTIFWMAVLGGLVGLEVFSGAWESIAQAVVSAIGCALGYFGYTPSTPSTSLPTRESIEQTA